MQTKKHKVFVYGTLKRGFHNHRLLDVEGAEFLSQAQTDDPFRLVVRSLPYVLHGVDHQTGKQIKGELYIVDDETFRRLDRLEGHPRFYERKKVCITTDEGAQHNAWVYFHPEFPHNSVECVTEYTD